LSSLDVFVPLAMNTPADHVLINNSHIYDFFTR
jgi:hypothetical protein